MASERAKSVLKTLPGFAISGFFIWWTYIRRHPDTGKRGFDPAAFRAIHVSSLWWIVAVMALTTLSYGTRSFRWWWMLRSVRSKFTTCTRVFMTSLAANNILPLRVGDIMRVFTYAPDLNSTPSTILSTVILEKLLDVFVLAVVIVVTMHFGTAVSPHTKLVAEMCVAISAVALLVLVFGARQLHAPVSRLAAKTENKVLHKLENWLSLAIDCIENIGVLGSLFLVVLSFVAWGIEGLMYLALVRAIGFATDWVGPVQAVAEANLSFLIPSSPGGIGPFELACADALTRHGMSVAHANAFGLILHLWLLVALTGVGGAMFMVHRAHKAMRKPLIEEVEALPSGLDA